MSASAGIGTTRPVDRQFGEGLRRLRRERRLSLVDLASRTNLSIGFLSQIERGLSSPTLRVMAGVADALGVGMGELFPSPAMPDGAGPATIIRKSKRSGLTLWRDGIRKELLTPQAEGARVSVYTVEMEPGASTGAAFYTHQGEEAGVVTQGAMRLDIESESWLLQEGDSFRFLSSRPHRFANGCDGISRVLWVNSL